LLQETAIGVNGQHGVTALLLATEESG